MANHREADIAAVNALGRGRLRRIIDPARPLHLLARRHPLKQIADAFTPARLWAKEALAIKMIRNRAGIIARHGKLVSGFGWSLSSDLIGRLAALRSGSSDAYQNRAECRWADEQAGETMPAAAFRHWIEAHAMTLDTAASALGLSRWTIAYYLSGEQPVPKTVMLATVGYERMRAA
jgi:hypothetical protein